MKKFICLILAILMLVSFAGCKNEKTDADATTEGNAPISADENLLTVTVTLAKSLFQGKTEEEIIASAKEEGIKKCEINEDGSVSYTMSKAKHKEMMKELEKSIKEASESFITGENKVESFLKIDANDDFSQFDIYVDPAKYTTWDSMTAMAFYMEGLYYQCLAGANFEEIDVVVNFIDNETKEVIDTGSYRQFADNMNTSVE